MPKLTRDGVELYYEVHGSGPALLLTHGYSATSQMWRGQIEVLALRYTVIVWDMRGHGQSDYPQELSAYSEAHTLADMAALLDAAGVERAIVGGLSLGGYMSLAFHSLHPQRVRALLIIDTGPGFKKDEARQVWNANAYQRADSLAMHGLSLLESGSAERALAVHRSADGLAKAARGMLTQHTSRVIESLPTIAVPTLVIVGADDVPFIAAAEYMAGKIPGATKVVIPNAGHAANLDQPATFNAALLEFLERLPEPAANQGSR